MSDDRTPDSDTERLTREEVERRAETADKLGWGDVYTIARDWLRQDDELRRYEEDIAEMRNIAYLQGLEDAKDELRRLREWQPIETAPRDGTDILVYCSDTKEQFVAYWGTPGKGTPAWTYAFHGTDARSTRFTCSPTHWKPLTGGPDHDPQR